MLTARLPHVHPLLCDPWEKHNLQQTRTFISTFPIIGIIILLLKTAFCSCLSACKGCRGTINIFLTPPYLALPLSSDVFRECIYLEHASDQSLRCSGSLLQASSDCFQIHLLFIYFRFLKKHTSNVRTQSPLSRGCVYQYHRESPTWSVHSVDYGWLGFPDPGNTRGCCISMDTWWLHFCVC